MNPLLFPIIILLLKLIIPFPVSFHLYADDYIVTIKNKNQPDSTSFTIPDVSSLKEWFRGLRKYGPFEANYGDEFQVILYNQATGCLYGLGGYMEVDGYQVSTNSDTNLMYFTCTNCTVPRDTSCPGNNKIQDSEGYRIIGDGDDNGIENYYEYIITIPPSLSHILEVRNETVNYVIQYDADNITIEFLLGEEKMIELSTYIKMIVNNYFLSDFDDKVILGDKANIQYELFDQIELYDEQNLIGLLTDVSSVSSGKKNYNVTYKSNSNKIEGYIESFQYYSNKTLVENENYVKSSYNGTITLKVCMLNCTNCPIVGDELVCYKCNTSYYLSKKQCVYECEGQVFLRESYVDNSKLCITKDKCNEKGYKVEMSDNLPRECIQQCNVNYPYTSKDNTECVKCNKQGEYINGDICDTHCQSDNDYKYLNNGTNICSKTCDMNYHLSENEIFERVCVDKCEGDYPYHIQYSDPDECVKECPDPYYTLEEKKECLTEEDCIGIGYYGNKKKKCTKTCLGTCEYLDDKIDECECTKEEISNILPEELLDVGKIIKGIGFYAEVYDSKEIPELNDKTSSLNISNCEKILREKNKIPDDEKLYIVKYDYENEDYLSFDYEIYYNNKKLNLSYCKDIELTTNIKISDDVNVELHSQFSENGIDLFNAKDNFFTDICTVSNIKNNSDITLKDRQKYFYLLEKYNLDESNCNYNSYNSTNKRISFDCNQNNDINTIKSTDRDNIVFPEKKRNWFENFLFKKNYNNILVFKCFNLFSNLKKNIFNLGFWFMLSVFLCQIISILFYFLKEKMRFNRNLEKIFKYIDNKIPKLDNYKKSKFERFYSKQYRVDTNEDSRFDNAFIVDKSIYDYKKIFFVPYNIALYYSEKKLCKDFCIIYKMKNIFLSIFNHISIFDLLNVNLSNILLHISVLFSINAFSINDDVVSNKFMTGKIPFKVHFKKWNISILFNSLICYFLLRLFNFSIVNLIINENNFSHFFYFEIFKSLYKKVKCKIFFFHFTQMIFTLLLWIYLTLYCFAYNNTQWDWFKQAWFSYIEVYILEFLFLLFISILRIIGLRHKIKYCYNTYLYLIWKF